MLSSGQPLAWLRAQQELHEQIADAPKFSTQRHLQQCCALAFSPDLLLRAEASQGALCVRDLVASTLQCKCALPWRPSAAGWGQTIWGYGSVAWSCNTQAIACVGAPSVVLYLVAWLAGQRQLTLQHTVELDSTHVRDARVFWAPCSQRLAVLSSSAVDDSPPQGWLVSAQGQVLHSWAAQLSLSGICLLCSACCSADSSMFAALVQPDDPLTLTSWVGVLRQDGFHTLPMPGCADCLVWAPAVGSGCSSSVLIWQTPPPACSDRLWPGCPSHRGRA